MKMFDTTDEKNEKEQRSVDYQRSVWFAFLAIPASLRRKRNILYLFCVIHMLIIIGYILKTSKGLQDSFIQYQITNLNLSSTDLVQPVYTVNNQHKLLIVSAFNDSRYPTGILVLAIGHVTTFEQKVYCLLWQKGKRRLRITCGIYVKKIWSSLGDFSGHSFLCPSPSTNDITHVSISTSWTNFKFNKVPVINIPAEQPRNPSVAACVCPIFGSRYNEAHIISWIEMNRMLGVSHFTFYNFSAPTRLRRVFNYYSEQGILTLLQWNIHSLPVDTNGGWPPVKDKVHYAGQGEANNDCLHRWTNRYKYLMFTDLDELIVPYSHDSLNALLSPLDYDSKVSVFIFPITVVLLNFTPSEVVQNHPFVKDRKLDILVRTTIQTKTLNFSNTKLIVNGHYVEWIAVHDVLRFSGGGHKKVMNSTMVRCLHYSSEQWNVSAHSTVERYLPVLILQPRLIRRMESVFQAILRS